MAGEPQPSMTTGSLLSIPQPVRGFIECVRDAIIDEYGSSLVAIALYGSVARGTNRPNSDIDLLVILDDLPSGIIDRVKTFSAVDDACADELRKLRDSGYQMRISPLLMSREDMQSFSMLHLEWVDASLNLFDPFDFFTDILSRTAEKLEELGTEKRMTDDGWYWVVKPDLKEGEVLIVEL